MPVGNSDLARMAQRRPAWCDLMILEQFTIRAPHDGIVDHRSPPEAKIAVFRGLFRGREDVHARRFESRKTGKTGYQPVCANEWVQGVCEKPRIKCTDCRHRRFISVKDEAIRWHLSGQDNEGKAFVMGIYPMLADETCFLLAIDFDKDGWQEDAKAFWRNMPSLERPGRVGTFSLRQRRAHLDFLRPGNPGPSGTQARLPYPDRNDGTPPRYRPEVL